MNQAVSRNGTDGRVYGGDCDLLHIPDGTRHEVGRALADFLTGRIREINGGDTIRAICPGCAMVALFDATVYMAHDAGQPTVEMARTMAAAFADLYSRLSIDPTSSPDASALVIEEIVVLEVA